MTLSAYTRNGQIVLRVPGGSLERDPVGAGGQVALDEASARSLVAELAHAIEERTAFVDRYVVVLGDSTGVLCKRCGGTWKSDVPLSIRVYERALDTFASEHAGCRQAVAS